MSRSQCSLDHDHGTTPCEPTPTVCKKCGVNHENTMIDRCRGPIIEFSFHLDDALDLIDDDAADALGEIMGSGGWPPTLTTIEGREYALIATPYGS